MVAGEIDDKEPLDFRADGADVGGVAKVDGESEAFESNVLKEVTVPPLGGGQLELKSARDKILDIPEVCAVGDLYGMKRCTLSSASPPWSNRRI